MLVVATAPVWPQRKNEDKPSPLHSIATRLKGNGIPRFGQVSKNLYRGGQPSADGLEELQKMGVQVVVDLRGSPSQTERDAVTRLGMQYVSIPSHCPFPRDKPWAHFLELIRENRSKKVFVHCRLGEDRTGLAVGLYRIEDEGWSPDEALREMKAFGFSRVQHVICPGMATYVRRFPERLKTHQVFRELTSDQDSK
jgi:tyrosine-protein phosphatase SIW14